MGKMGLMAGASAIAMTMMTGGAQAQVGPSNAELAARVQALEDALAARDERAANDRTRLSTLEQGYNSAVWGFDNGRPTFSTGDGRFTMNIRMRFQTDYANFFQDKTHPAGFAGPTDLSSGAVMRRAYFGVDGKVYSDFSYDVRLNAGGSNGGTAGAPPAGEGDPLLNRMYVSYTGLANWHFNVGILEPAFLGEGTTSSSALIFMERPEIDNIGADSFGAGDSRRGIEIGWAKTDALWAGDNLAFTAAFTGGKTGSPAGHGNGGDEQSQVLARLSERLWTNGLSNIQVGVNAAQVLYSGNAAGGGAQQINLQDRPQVRVDGTRLISTGGINAKNASLIGFDLEGNLDNFYGAGAWTQFSVARQCGAVNAGFGCATTTTVYDHPTFSGWYLEGTWVLTGETKPYTPSAINNEVGAFGNPVPSRPFSLSGDSWGAWELAARYSETDLDWHPGQVTNATNFLPGITGGREKIVTLGVNWYLNRNVKLQLNDMIVKVEKSSTTAAANLNNQSQDLNILGVRLAFAN